MRRTWKVVAHEWLTAFQRPSFLFFAFGIPVIFLVIFTGIRLYQGLSSQESPLEDNVEEQELKVEGFVDYAGLIKNIPPDLPAGILIQLRPNKRRLRQFLPRWSMLIMSFQKITWSRGNLPTSDLIST
jgi:hypothetical protein